MTSVHVDCLLWMNPSNTQRATDTLIIFTMCEQFIFDRQQLTTMGLWELCENIEINKHRAEDEVLLLHRI